MFGARNIMISEKIEAMKTESIDKKTVCEVLKYEKDIVPYPVIKIYSGVGSGKSYFAGKMITGSEEYGIPEHHVLIITSRRAKVEETLKELDVEVKPIISRNGNLTFKAWETGEDRPEKYEKFLRTVKYDNEFGEYEKTFYNQSAVCRMLFFPHIYAMFMMMKIRLRIFGTSLM